MAVKTLSTLLDRLKLGLRDEVCTLCQVVPRQKLHPAMLCPTCERRILLRQPVPVMTLSTGALYAACEFPYRIKQLIYGLKFDQKHQHGLPLSEILIHYWQQLPESSSKGWVIAPVPPHQGAQMAHVSLFARPFASHFGYDFMENGLAWQRETECQHTLLNKRKRRENIAGAFTTDPTLFKRFGPRMKILVMDDLLTSGATLVEAVSTLKRAYPDAHVVALAVSHMPLAVARPTLE